MLKQIAIASILFFPVMLTAQTNALRFSVPQLQQDYEIFVRALKEAHPGLHRYTSQKSFDSIFDATSKQINHAMTEEEFYELLMPVVSSIKCGHTKWYPDNKPDDRYPFRSDGLFPLKLYFVDGKAFVLYSYNSDTTIKPASEIISINNEPIASIINELHKYITIDGNIQSALYEELNHSFNGYFATFIKTAPSYAIAYSDGKNLLHVTLPSVNLSSIQKRDELEKLPHQLPLRLFYPSPNIAVLTIE
ncbi:MAG: peptidase S41, partial [Bacteroidetes bacterium]|nr:peptidase S41 [Bacteroidota bacterium]